MATPCSQLRELPSPRLRFLGVCPLDLLPRPYCYSDFLLTFRIFGLAFVVSIGLLFNVLACVIWSTPNPIFVVIAYFLAPIPNLIFGRCVGYEDRYGHMFKDIGFFLTGICIVSGFALPGVLAHVNLMSPNALFMALAGGTIVYCSILVYLHYFHKPATTDPFLM